MTIQDKAYKDLCKQFSEAVRNLRRRQRLATVATIINVIACVLNLLCIYWSLRG